MANHSHSIPQDKEMLRRFERSEIILHWVNAIPFLILFVTGALNILSRFEIFIPPYIGAIRIIHKIAGVLWIAGIGYSFFFVGRDLNIANLRDQFKVNVSDITWMIKAMRSIVNPHIEVPPVGKFNIGQKMNAVMVILYAVAFTSSGALIWAYKTMLLPWYFHAAVFFMAAASLGGHLYLSFVHPSTRPGLIGIFNGMVPRSYIVHHHGLMIDGGAHAHRASTPKEAVLFMKTERSSQKPGTKRAPDVLAQQAIVRPKNIYAQVDRVSAGQSRYPAPWQPPAPAGSGIRSLATGTNKPSHGSGSPPHSRSAVVHAGTGGMSRSLCVPTLGESLEGSAAPANAHAHDDPDARLLAAWHGVHDHSPDEIDMQKAWSRSGSIQLPQN